MSNIRSEMIMLSNLNCPVCAAKLETAVRGTPGVSEAKVIFGAGSLNVTYDADAVSFEQMWSCKVGLGVGRVPRA